MRRLVCGKSGVGDMMSEVNKLVKLPVKTLITLGASIMGRFDDPDMVNPVKSLYGFRNVTLVDEANSGESVAQILARLPDILTTYDNVANVVFMIHAGGNNVSATRPYTNLDEDGVAGIATDMQAIVRLIQAGGHTAIMSSISYRSYGGISEDQGSKPYNDNIVIPLIRSMMPEYFNELTGRPIVDMYEIAFNDPSLLKADGIHPTLVGDDILRAYWFERLATVLRADIPDNPVIPASLDRLCIDLNNEASDAQTNARISKYTEAGEGEISLISGLSGIRFNIDPTSFGNNGHDVTTNTTSTLSNSALVKSYVFTGGSASAYVGNIKEGTTAVLTILASRGAGAGRVGKYTVQGVTKNIDSGLTDPGTETWDVIFDSDGRVVIDIEVATGSNNAYINGIDLAFN